LLIEKGRRGGSLVLLWYSDGRGVGEEGAKGSATISNVAAVVVVVVVVVVAPVQWFWHRP